jgi:hypothetical protein
MLNSLRSTRIFVRARVKLAKACSLILMRF